MKFLFKILKRIIKKLFEKKQPQFGKIEVENSKIIIIIHKD